MLVDNQPSSRLLRISHWLSLVLHPAVVMALTAILLSASGRSSFLLLAMDVALLIGGLLPGILYIWIKTKRGEFGHYNLLLKEERRTVFPILLIGLLAVFVIYHLVGTPTALTRGVLAAV